jgi:hypothetical protein
LQIEKILVGLQVRVVFGNHRPRSAKKTSF